MAKSTSKQNLPAKTPDKKTPSTRTTAGLPAFLEEVEMKGVGVATSPDDLLIPMARILQKGSPEVERKSAAYVAGAEAGKIIVKGAIPPIIDGETGFLFQPCHRSRAVVEWLPRGAGGGGGKGFRGRYPKMPADAIEVAEPQDQSGKRKIPVSKTSGNVYVDTRYYAGFIISEDEGEPPLNVVLPFTGANHSVGRAWNTLMSHKRNSRGEQADIWSVYYRLTTLFRDENGFTWYNYVITDSGDVVDGIA